MNLFSISHIQLFAGVIILILGIIFFSGKTYLSRRNYSIARIIFTSEAIGILLFIIGGILIIAFLIGLLEPSFLSKGLG
ncbi:MAG: hypothetical protein LH473_07995 [Chitinophagales bacterium]|nr:hypothetical protein [Chitinophagales bacterium]